MDEEYTESVDTSSDMDVSDADVAGDSPTDIPDDIPEDIPEDSSSDRGILGDLSEDVSNDDVDVNENYEEIDDSLDEDTTEPLVEELDDFKDDVPEDLYEGSDEPSEVESEIEDMPEDIAEDESDTDGEVADVDDNYILEDTDETSDIEQDASYEKDIPEDVIGTEAIDEFADVEDTDTTEQLEDTTDAEATNENANVEDMEIADHQENWSDTDAKTDATDNSDLETYDYETSPETLDSVNPETSGEYVSADNPYRERWEEFSKQFSNGKDKTGEWDSLKDVPFAEDDQTEINAVSDVTSSAEASETPEISTISDSMNVHNYGPDDFETYSQDPQRRGLHSTVFPNDDLPPISTGVSEQDIKYQTATNNDSGDMEPPDGSDSRGVNHTRNPDNAAEGEMFESFETDKHMSGSESFIKGDNYEQFKMDYYSSEGSTYEAYDTPKEIYISPSMIEGIHLGERELEDPTVFWSQHEKGGTIESFKEIAFHIPEVREQLAAGKAMDELLADPELSECAGIYFANKPKVIENDGYYEFDSNGRHRILAAREAGYDIPVEMIGRRSRSDGIEIQNTENGEFHANIRGDLSGQFISDDKEFGSFADRIKNFFTYPQDVDLIEPGTNNTLEPNQDMYEKWMPPAIEGVDVKEPKADIVPLNVTRQSINLIDLPDGSKGKVFDHPDDLKNILPFSQGKNEYAKNGTCALADTGTWLRIAGSKHTENDVVGFASTHADKYGQPLCSKSGGTLPSNIPDIWEHFGIPAYNDSSKNLENIAEAVESGRAVSVGVNAGTLWCQDNVEGIKISQNCYGDGGANHAIGIMSCERDSINGNITHFYINDTGRSYERDACRKISIGDFLKAFKVKRACATISQKPVW